MDSFLYIACVKQLSQLETRLIPYVLSNVLPSCQWCFPSRTSSTLLPCSVFSALFHPPPEHPVAGVSFSSHFPPLKTLCWGGTYREIFCLPGCLLGRQHSEMRESHSVRSEADGSSGRDQRCHHHVPGSSRTLKRAPKASQNPDTTHFLYGGKKRKRITFRCHSDLLISD